MVRTQIWTAANTTEERSIKLQEDFLSLLEVHVMDVCNYAYIHHMDVCVVVLHTPHLVPRL